MFNILNETLNKAQTLNDICKLINKLPNNNKKKLKQPKRVRFPG